MGLMTMKELMEREWDEEREVKEHIEYLERKTGERTPWTVIKDDYGAPTGILCAAYGYFIESKRFTHKETGEDSLHNWIKHLRQKFWFNEKSELSFFHAYSKLITD